MIIFYFFSDRYEVIEFIKINPLSALYRDKHGRSPLFYAETKKEAEHYLAWGANANETDRYGGTPLLMAVGNDNKTLADYLISRGAIVSPQNSAALLFGAIDPKVEQKEMVELLLRKGANPNVISKKGVTPVELAFEYDYMGTVAILHRYGAKIKTVECAAAVNDIPIIKRFLDDPLNNPNYYRLLYYATSREVSEWMMSKGAYFNPGTNGVEMMERAAKFGYRDKVAFLLSMGVNVDSMRDKDSRITSLFIAAGEGHYDVVELLLNNGADVNLRCKDGDSPLCYAVYGGNYRVVELLLRNGAKLYGMRNSILYYARELNRNDIVDLLSRYNTRE